MNNYFKVKNHNPKQKYEKFELLATILKSVDTFAILATTSSSITLSLSGISLIVIPSSTGRAFGTISKKVILETVIQKYNRYKKQYQNDQQTIRSFDKLYKKSVQDNVFERNDYESLRKTFSKYLNETKNRSFWWIWTKNIN